MTFAIFTLVEHTEHDGQYYGYAPYINQINLWIAHAHEVVVIAPRSKTNQIGKIQIPYDHSNITLVEVPSFNTKTIIDLIRTLFYLPVMIFKIQKVMRKASHLHFRCPSNVSAIALMVQIFFPSKAKTAKYAGNWDPKSVQPTGYKFQKWMLSNTTFTKNMKALVFGEWPNQSSNIRSFVSASYHEIEREPHFERSYEQPLKFVFIGSLVEGKRPMLCLHIIEALNERGVHATLDMYGDGALRDTIEGYVEEHNLKMMIQIHGNQDRITIKSAIKNSDFSILPSKSEGWPKAIAEAMFYGCIPISTRISCLEWMLGHGKRGILIEPEVDEAVKDIMEAITSITQLQSMSLEAYQWAQQFTVERIQKDIADILMTK